MNLSGIVVYWDASSVLSTLFRDSHSEEALRWLRLEGVHLISSLAYAETCAVIFRLRQERLLAEVLIEAAFETLTTGPWRRLNLLPAWDNFKNLASRWPLRGADLWHLTLAKTLKSQIPELVLLSFDERLKIAAKGEGLV